MTTLLTVNDLTIEYFHDKKPMPAVRGVNLSLEAGETLGLVGESGCGKSTLALSIIGLLPPEESRIPKGRIMFQDQNLLSQTPAGWRGIRGKKIGMVFQDPFSALNPVLTVEYQLQETIALELGNPNRERALQLLEQVQLADPERILKSYPHQISGGQRQRVMIACALARNPSLFIADEPTTALDVTIQDEILSLLQHLQKEMKMSMIFVTHNMGLVKGISDKLAVMYAGEIVEFGKTEDVLNRPKHPYTQGLLRSIPKLQGTEEPIPVLQGQPPEPHALPSGCAFHPRCDQVLNICPNEDPLERKVDNKTVRCHLYELKN